MKYRVLDIIRGTTVDGPGFRTSIYLAGCSHQCYLCQNPQSWDPEAGSEMLLEDLIKIIEEEDFDVTLSGGDPLFYPQKLQKLIEAIKNNRRNIWVYTGFTWEEILNSPSLLKAIEEADVLVDGEYIHYMRDPDLPFRGSSNQRIIDVKASLKAGEIVLIRRS